MLNKKNKNSNYKKVIIYYQSIFVLKKIKIKIKNKKKNLWMLF